MADQFANDPKVRGLERREARAKALNWHDERRRHNSSEFDPEKPGPCPTCGADETFREEMDVCCAECGAIRAIGGPL